VLARHPLAAYFALAFLGTWLFFAPIVLSRRGAGLLPFDLPDAAGLILFFLATYTGPLLAGFLVTGAAEGRPGVRRLARRIVQWRVGLGWYLLVLAGYPVVFLLGLRALAGVDGAGSLVAQWPLLATSYLPNILLGLLLPSLGEETGWRGFALPRLQWRYGPLWGSLILGALHGVWHLPAYFVPGAILPSAFDPTVFVANTLAIVASTIVWTWLFNHAGGSVLFAMLIHATSNATSALIPQLIPDIGGGNPWFVFQLMSIVALVLVVLTRGRLGYKVEREQLTN
jgi:membrane protease YdiL (CAAX protease family)